MNSSFVILRAVSRALTVLIAVVIANHYSLGERFWLTITAILVMQTAVGVSLRQGIQRFIVIIASVAAGTMLTLIIRQPMLLYLIMAGIFSVACYYATKDSVTHFSITMPILIGFALLLAMLFPVPNADALYARLYDVTFGAALGIGANLLIFPSRADVEFRYNIVPVLNAYADYLTSIVNLFFDKEMFATQAQDQKAVLEKILAVQTAFFPTWVYEAGFSVALRQGHRHFLIMVERLGQILYSMHHLARHPFAKELLQEVHEPVVACSEQAKKIMAGLVTVLNFEKFSGVMSDLHAEITELEKVFNSVLPPATELTEMSLDYIYFAGLIADLKDLRMALIKLAQALRS